MDLSATALLGLAAVLIAWGSYQSTLWGGVQDRLLTESVNTTTQATDLLQQADTIRSLDQVLFVELFSSGVCDEGADVAVCDQIFANMSTDGVEAVEGWLTNDDLAPFGEAYDEALYRTVRPFSKRQTTYSPSQTKQIPMVTITRWQ